MLCSVDGYERHSLKGYALALGAGGMSRVGDLEIGGVLTLDIPLPHGGGSYAAVTGNLVLGFSLPAP